LNEKVVLMNEKEELEKKLEQEQILLKQMSENNDENVNTFEEKLGTAAQEFGHLHRTAAHAALRMRRGHGDDRGGTCIRC